MKNFLLCLMRVRRERERVKCVTVELDKRTEAFDRKLIRAITGDLLCKFFIPNKTITLLCIIEFLEDILHTGLQSLFRSLKPRPYQSQPGGCTVLKSRLGSIC